MTDIQIQRGRSGSSSSTMPEEEADMGETEDGFLEVDLGDGYLPPRSPRVCVRSTAPYLADQGFERYQYALRNLIPVRRKPSKKTDIGVDHSGLISFVMSTWFSKLMYKAHRKGLLIEDIPQGSPLDSCDHNVQRLEVLWQEELRNHGPSDASLSRAVWRFVRTRVIADWILYTVSCVLGFLTPMVFMRKLLEFAQDPDATLQTGFIYAFLLMICEIFRIFFFSWRSVMSFRTAVRLRVACLGLLYKKIVRLNNFEEKFIGQLINIFANDSERVFDVVVFGPMLISGPMVLVAGVGYVLSILSPWALSGIFVIVAFYPIQYFISRVSALMRAKTIRVTDQRVGLMNEILMHIKTIKVNAWEECFADKIFSIRAREQRLIEKRSYLASLGSSLAPTIPIIAAIVSFLSHIGAGNTLTAAQAFSVQALYSNSIRNIVRVFTFGFSAFYDAQVGLNRVQKFLLVEEIQSSVQRPIDRGQAVSIGGGTFAWSPVWNPGVRISSKKKEKKKLESPSKKSDNEEAEKLTCGTTENVGLRPVLQAINFCAPKGYLVGVCGPIGAGKTSLLLSILGQMRLVNGQLARSGSCAFVSQHAWITNGTVRDNILFGETFVSARYYSVINSCALNEDFNQFPGGDLTEIGERGVNLSGGQRQRVALARALYANKDIYLLDDPLSAVDVTVGAAVFENYIQRQLRNKTVILVTHQIQYLSQCDEVYLMKDGRIVERGSHEELLNVNYEYASMVRQSQGNPAESSGLEEKVLSNKQENCTSKEIEVPVPLQHNSKKKKLGESLTVNEPTNCDSVKTDTYFRYISAAGGYLMASLVFVVFFSHAASSAFSSWWLATWIKAGGGNTTIKVNNATVASANLADNPDFKYYQNVYVSTIGLILFCIALRCFVVTKATIRASAVIHTELFHKVVNSRMLFFETNPIGRMQNVFTRDMDEVDTRLPLSVENVIGNFWIVAFAVMFICIVFPWFFVAFIPIAIIYSFLSIIFRKGIRDLKRLENTTRSPVFSNLVETVNGLNTIRAFNKEGEYIQRFFQLIDENSTCSYLWNVGMRWLAVRIDLLAAITISTTAVLVVALHGYVAPALAGLALSYSWHISGVLQYTTRLVSETEVRFISVERILAYIETALKEGKQSTSKPPASWPSEGRISFQNVSMSYRQNLPNVLNNVSFNFLPGEKVGIVGRTGSGKTSLTVALFRLVELSNGSIKLDGMDIAGIPLSVLRSNITIVPQDPVLFSGSIRSNLDPKNKSSDPEIWEALRKSRLAERISTFPLKLETVVSSGSSGLSVGECQLLCLTRALLKKSKILILDEATASIDPETEAVTQLTLQEEFKTCTVLTIAHRLLTVKNCDRILVMDEGKVIEFEETEKLLADSNSVFARMVASMEST